MASTHEHKSRGWDLNQHISVPRLADFAENLAEQSKWHGTGATLLKHFLGRRIHDVDSKDLWQQNQEWAHLCTWDILEVQVGSVQTETTWVSIGRTVKMWVWKVLSSNLAAVAPDKVIAGVGVKDAVGRVSKKRRRNIITWKTFHPCVPHCFSFIFSKAGSLQMLTLKPNSWLTSDSQEMPSSVWFCVFMCVPASACGSVFSEKIKMDFEL